MKHTMTCEYGETSLLSTRYVAPISVETRIVPIAGIPQPPAEPTPMLPEWIIVPILMYLFGVSVVIVLVGWWMALPTPVEPIASTPSVVAIAPPAIEETPIAREEPVVVEPAATDSFVLPRRMPSPVEDAAPAIREPAPEKSTVEQPLPTASALDTSPTTAEPKKDESAPLHFSLRRLRLSDDAPKPLKLAVTPRGHDDVGSILTKMGEGYRFTSFRNQDLLSDAALRYHDVLFLTCANIYAQDFQSVLPLRKFVEQGGTLYASDLRSDIVLAAFPEFRAKTPILPGVPQSIEARITDSSLASYLGRTTIPLTFDAPGWRPAAFDPNKVTILLKGAYRNELGQAATAPLLVKFRVKRGTVIFTSFHHSKNDSEIVRKLLDYLVFASVNARSEARVRELMQRYDFSPEDLRPVILNPGQANKGTFQHKDGGLQIALGFENQGAKLKLTLRAPTGQTVEHEDQGIYLIDIPKAPAGAWQYTVSPLELPYANFPILVAVGSASREPKRPE